MAGYSGTPLPKKLGIQDGDRVLVLDPPEGYPAGLGEVPRGATVRTSARGRAPFDVIIIFTPCVEVLSERFSAAARRLVPSGGLWVAWPKKASGVPTNLDENVVREVGLAAGLVDNKVCAIDETWSGLRFVYRLKDRPRR